MAPPICQLFGSGQSGTRGGTYHYGHPADFAPAETQKLYRTLARLVVRTDVTAVVQYWKHWNSPKPDHIKRGLPNISEPCGICTCHLGTAHVSTTCISRTIGSLFWACHYCQIRAGFGVGLHGVTMSSSIFSQGICCILCLFQCADGFYRRQSYVGGLRIWLQVISGDDSGTLNSTDIHHGHPVSPCLTSLETATWIFNKTTLIHLHRRRNLVVEVTIYGEVCHSQLRELNQILRESESTEIFLNNVLLRYLRKNMENLIWKSCSSTHIAILGYVAYLFWVYIEQSPFKNVLFVFCLFYWESPNDLFIFKNHIQTKSPWWGLTSRTQYHIDWKPNHNMKLSCF